MEEQARGKIRSLAERLKSANSVCVLTGAGVSKESGVPTFRDADGLWNTYRPEELANVEAFLHSPTTVWEWYQWRRDLINKVEPNPGHYALAALEQIVENFVLITQNVDNLHQRSGSQDVIEVHGNIHRTKCFDCGAIYPPGFVGTEFRENHLPLCSRCETGRLRPDVVWFGEMLPDDKLTQAVKEVENCDIFLSIGTSSIVYPAAALPRLAKSSGAFLVEVNPVPTELANIADCILEGPSGEILPELVKILKS